MAEQQKMSIEKAIIQLQRCKQDKCSFKQIAVAMGKTRSSLTQIDVLMKDRTWQTITDKTKIHNRLLAQN